MKKTIALLLVLSSCKKENVKPPSLDNDIERVCKSELIFAHTPGIVIGIIKNGAKKLYSYGTQNLSSGKAFDEFTTVEIGSITKTFTALLYADMSLNNIVSLNDSANKYLPVTLKIPSKNGIAVTVKELLNHTSGLDNEPPKLDVNQPFLFNEADMSAYLKNTSLLSNPGAGYLYSNTGVGLAGYMTKQISGKPFNQLVKQKIFQPLGMTYTYCDSIANSSAALAQGYYGNNPVDFYSWSPVFEAAGNIKSNMHDMLIYMDNAINTNQSIYKNAFELTEQPTFTISDKLKIGLGWHLLSLDSNEIIWHNGGTHGFHTFIGFNKPLKYGVVVFSNSYSIDDIDLLAIQILRILNKY